MLAAPQTLGPGRLSGSAALAHRHSVDARRLLSYSGQNKRAKWLSLEKSSQLPDKKCPKRKKSSAVLATTCRTQEIDSSMRQERKEWRGMGRGRLLSIIPPTLGSWLSLSFRHLYTQNSSSCLHNFMNRPLETNILRLKQVGIIYFHKLLIIYT